MTKARTPSTSTLDTFLRPSASTSSSSRTASTSKKRPSTPSQSPASKRTAIDEGNATKKLKKVAKVKKVKKPLKEDNRNLGTLDLLDDSDDDEACASVIPVREAAKVDKKGKGKMVLEEEDWMMNVDDSISQQPQGGESRGESCIEKKPLKEEASFEVMTDDCCEEPILVEGTAMKEERQNDDVMRDRGDEDEEAKQILEDEVKKLADPTKQDPKDGCGAEREGIGGGETIELSSDEEDDVQVEGGLTCPSCKLDLEALTTKKRNLHVSSCVDEPSPAPADTKSFLQRGFLAPISRLFSRPAAETASTSKPPSTASSSSMTKSNSNSGISKPLTSALPNAFTALMAGHAESTQWKEADVAAKQKGRMPKGEDRKVPFYKWIDGMQITVDAFKYGKIEGCKGYFLSHAHSDHYQNLSSSWNHGPIYCSLTTANLIKLKLKVDDKWVHALPLDKTVKVQGIDVTLIDANHCPGSVLFLFEGPHTDPKSPYTKTPSRIFRHLHCGDFRASPQHILHPSMSFPTPSPNPTLLPACLRSRTPKKIDSLYLDTTYLSPSYCFPAQELVISACADLVRERVVEGKEEALWRADGREGERMGIKGWLSGKVKDEVKDEEGGDLVKEEQETEPNRFEESPRIERMKKESSKAGDDDDEEWRLVHEMESQGQDTPRETPAPFDSSTFDNDGDSQQWSFEEVPPLPEEQEDEDYQYMLDTSKKEEENDDHKLIPEDEDVKPTLNEDVKPKLEGDDEKPDLKPDVKPKKERLLVLVGTYSIGKERIVKAIAHALNTKIYADPRKKELFIAQDDPDLHALLTDDPLEGQVHVGYLQNVQRDAMLEYLAKYKAPRIEGGFTKMIGLRPTGWTYRSESKDKFPSIPKILQLEQSRKFSPAGLYPQRDSTALCMGFGVPYSEHSSFFELTCFCLSLDYVRIIPTVNVHTVNSRNKMKEWIDRWAAEKKRRNDSRFPKVIPYRNENYW